MRREILPRAIVLASPLFGASVEILAQASSEQAMASSSAAATITRLTQDCYVTAEPYY
ncbi:hypothetical protein [Candidatus Binatus sp.]|uniref:hypothetical protein n=1 Tax=Candidatus Binatus sp. TaxID=2811406 RepID=UPI003C818FD5